MSPVASLWVYQRWMDDFNNLAGWELDTAFRKIIRDHPHLRLLGESPNRGEFPNRTYRLNLMVPPFGESKVRLADSDPLTLEGLLPTKYSRGAYNHLDFSYDASGHGVIQIKFSEFLKHKDRMILLLDGTINATIEGFVVQSPDVHAQKTDSRPRRLCFKCPNSQLSEADCECPTCCIRRHLERILA